MSIGAGQVELEDLFPRWLTHMAVKVVLTVSWKLSGHEGPLNLGLSMWASLQNGGCISKVSIPRERD